MTGPDRGLPMLLLHDDCGHYCTAPKDLVALLKKLQPESEVLDWSRPYLEGGRRALQERLRALVREKGIKIIFFSSAFGAEFDLDFLEELRRQATMVLFLEDSALFFNDWHRYIIQPFDLVVTHDEAETHRYILYGAKGLFFPLISDIEALHRLDPREEDKDIPVSFIGRLDRVGRREPLERLLAGGVGLQLYGDGTPGGRVSAAQVVDIFRRTKIGLNFTGAAEYFHNKSVRHVDKRIRQAKGRLWQLALCQALVLTENAPALERSFKIGEEIDVFEDEAELLEKVRFYLKHEDRRREMALKGRRRALRDTEPRQACERLLEAIHAAARSKRYRPAEIHLDEEYLERTCEDRAALAAKMWHAGRLALAWAELKEVFFSRRFLRTRAAAILLKELVRPWFERHPAAYARVRAAPKALAAQAEAAR